jgi:hypothetical protein
MTDVIDMALVIGYGKAAQLHWDADWRGIGRGARYRLADVQAHEADAYDAGSAAQAGPAF